MAGAWGIAMRVVTARPNTRKAMLRTKTNTLGRVWEYLRSGTADGSNNFL